MKKLYSLIIFSTLVLSCQPPQKSSSEYVGEIGPLGENVMVSSAHPLATKVGVDILKNGGNAIDAAIARLCLISNEQW
jgi:gamma-glutamyltranspeptidase/glutathione hydrolase